MVRLALSVTTALVVSACASGTTSVAASGQALHPTDAAVALERVTNGANEERDPAVSPDGKFIAYEEVTPAGARSVVVASLDTRPPTVRFRTREPAMQPSWIPNTASLVYVSLANHRHTIMRVDPFLPDPRVWLVPAGDPYHDAVTPAVSSDGKLALSMTSTHVHTRDKEADFKFALAVLDVDQYGTQGIFGDGRDPAWSGDGARLAFARESEGHLHLFVAPQARDARGVGAGAVRISEGAQDDSRPSWSPDNQWIAFCSTRTEGASTISNLFIAKSDGSGMVQLTESDGVTCSPSWSKDGWMYFHADHGGRSHIWRLKLRPRD